MNGTSPSTALQTGSKMIDDFLRRELRIGDPRNPNEVVTALRRRYAGEAARIDQEASGLPVRAAPATLIAEVLPSAAAGETPGSREQRRVQANLEADLTALIDAPANREWRPELLGWRALLPRELADGAAAARWAQDPAQRDRAFLAVRRMGEFARVARLVGVMNLPVNCEYRRLATTLDEAANAVRILMGEALYHAGLADGGIMVQVPVVDIRQRRDALMAALRRLAGIEEAEGDWGDDAAAYGWLVDTLDRRSAGELKVYLREEMFSVVIDGMVAAVARQDPEALRQVASTLPIEVSRLARLLHVADGQEPPPFGSPARPLSAPLENYVHTLQLFIDAFSAPRSGARLIDLGVPLAMAAQQADEPDRIARQILRQLVSLRGDYGREVECFLSCCGCDTAALTCQVKLDKVLYDLDRAIDLYALGTGSPPDWGEEERRASAYGLVAGNLALDACVAPPATDPLRALLLAAEQLLAAATPADPAVALQVRTSVFEEQLRAELEWQTLVQAMAPRCLNPDREGLILAGRTLLHGSKPDYSAKNPAPYRRPALLPPERVSAARIARGVDNIGEEVGTPRPQAPPPPPTTTPPPLATEPGLSRDECDALAKLLREAARYGSENTTAGEWNAWVNRTMESPDWRFVQQALATAGPVVERCFGGLMETITPSKARHVGEDKRTLLTLCRDIHTHLCTSEGQP